MMWRVWLVAMRELRRAVRFPSYLMLLTVLPAVSLIFFSALFERGIPHDLPIVVVDLDRTPTSRKLIKMISASPETEVCFEAQDALQAEQLMRSEKADAIVLIDRGFERDILSASSAKVGAYVSGANVLKNGLISKGLISVTSTFAAGIDIEFLASLGLPTDEAMAQAVPIRLSSHLLFNPYTNYSYYLTPLFMPMMLIVFTILTTIFAIGSELRYSTSEEWLAAADGSLIVAVVGKLLPTFVAMTMMAAIELILLLNVVGAPMRGSVCLLLLASEILILAYIDVAIFVVALTADMRLAMSLGGGYSVMAFSLSGVTFPAMAMYGWVRWMSHLFPFTAYSRVVIDVVMRGAPNGEVMTEMCEMLAFLLLPIAVWPRLRRVVSERKYWGKE